MAPVDARDLASAAACLLIDPDVHAGQTYPITGPHLLTAHEQVEILQGVLGRPLRFEDVPEATAREQMGRFVPSEVVEALFTLMRDAREHPDGALHTVERITGGTARTFAEWARDHIDAFR